MVLYLLLLLLLLQLDAHFTKQVGATAHSSLWVHSLEDSKSVGANFHLDWQFDVCLLQALPKRHAPFVIESDRV